MPGSDATGPIAVGRTLGGRYRLIAPIARGGMAEVWEGYDEVLSRPVAVKVLQAHLAVDGLFLERFRREAVTAARLAHPGVVATFDTGVDAGIAYIVMELVRGRTLRDLLTERGTLEPWVAVAITRQIADALAHAHQAGLVHRDIKPANVLLVDDGWGGLRVKVTDFGIAKAGASLGADLTRTGTVLGTPKYLSPEQIRGLEPDPRADLYSLGVVLYEMLTGVAPFTGSTDMTIALAHLNDRVPKVSSRVKGVPPALERLTGDLLAKDPDRRVESAVALRQRLDTLGPLAPSTGSANGLRSLLRPRNGGPVRPAPGPATTALRPPVGSMPDPGAPAATSVLAAGPGPNGAGTPPTAVISPAGPGRPSGPGGPGGKRSSRRGSPSPGVGPAPGLADAPPGRRQPPRGRRAGRTVSWVVLSLVVAGAAVAAVLITTNKHGSETPASPPASGTTSRSAPHLVSANVYMNVSGHTPDDPQGAGLVLDGNPATFWTTDHYANPTFGNLYSGLGLAVEVSSTTKLHHLVVTSPSSGWAAQAYVANSLVANGQPLSAWGQPTDTKTGISGNTTLSLGGKTGRWVLLWLTYLGPSKQVRIAEVSIN